MVCVTALGEASEDVLSLHPMDLIYGQHFSFGVGWVFHSVLDAESMITALALLLLEHPEMCGRVKDGEVQLSNEGIEFDIVDRTAESVLTLPHDLGVDPGLGMPDQAAVMCGEVAPMMASLQQFRDGSVLALGGSHVTTDGAGFYAIIARWAELTREVQQARDSDATHVLHISPTMLHGDRGVLPLTPQDLAPVIRFFASSPGWSRVSAPPTVSRRTFAQAMNAPPCRKCVHFTNMELDAIKEAASSGTVTVSRVNALCAHIVTSLVTLFRLDGDVNIVLSISARVGIPELRTFTGNAVYLEAVRVRDLGQSCDLPRLAQLLDARVALNRGRAYAVEALSNQHALYENHLPFSSSDPLCPVIHTNFHPPKHCLEAIDFGSGAPVRVVPRSHGETVVVVPAINRGADVYISARGLRIPESQFEEVAASDLWSKMMNKK